MSIILALLVALVGPLLVDWTAYRAAFEARATEILGHPVRVTGTADATLLPVPELAFTGVTIGRDPDHPLMTVGRFQIEVELFPLLRGEVRVTRMALEKPEITLRVGGDGTVEWLAGGATVPVDPRKVVFDRIDVTDGRVSILDARRPLPVEITGVNATLEARSLVGPYRFDGGAVVDGEPVMLRIATGERDDSGRVTVKATANPANAPVVITLDGALQQDDGQPRFEGNGRLQRVVAEGDPAMPWQVEAELDADPNRLRARALEFRYGPEDRPFTISGAATVDLAGEPSFDAVLSARQIDLDRTLGAGPDKPVSFEGAISAMAGTIAALPRPPMPGRVGFDIPGIVVGGSLVQNVRLDLATAAEGWTVETLEAALPGRSRLTASGQLATRPQVEFDGTVQLASEQPPTLVAWWYPQRQRTELQPFDGRARVNASAAGLRLTGLDTRLGKARIAGEVGYLPPRAERNASLTLALSADTVAVEQVAAVAGLFTGEGETPDSTDVVLQLTADRVTGGETAGDGVEVAASLVGGTLTVDRFVVRDLAGARISASGAVRDIATAPDGSMQARVAAERLDGLAGLVRAVAPGSAAARLLETAAPVLVPASLEATVTAARIGEGTNATVAVNGTAGGSTVEGRLAFGGRVDRWHEASVDLSTDLTGPNGVRLMRQLGFDVPETASAGAGRLNATVRGIPAENLEVTLAAALGATRLDLSGTAKVPAADPPGADLDVHVASDDAGPILALGGSLMADVLASTPVDLRAKTTLAGSVLSFAGLTGTVDGEPVTGDLSVDVAPEIPAVRGALALQTARLEGLLELAFGAGTLDLPFTVRGSPWPEAPFGPTALDGLDTDVAISVERASVGDGLAELGGLKVALRSSAAGIGFDEVAADLAGGKLSGSLVVKRDLEGEAAVSGTFKLEGAAAEALAWRRGDQPVATGRLGLDLEVNATGRTVAGLMSTLAGGGTLAVTDGEIRFMNPRAFSAVIRAADAGQELPDERIRALFEDNVDVGNLPFQRVEGAFTITSGVLRAPSLVVTGTGGEATTAGSAVIDWPKLTLESDWRLALAAADQGAGTAPPEVDILFRGPLAAPERRIDVTALSSYLGIRAFERETERVLVMQADILERELLSRQVLRVREEAERRARAEEEARRRAEEEARRRAEEEAARRAAEANGGAPALEPDDFTDTIERRLEDLIPPDDSPSPPATAPSEIERVPLGPPAGAAPPTRTPPPIGRIIPPESYDPSLPGVAVPAPL